MECDLVAGLGDPCSSAIEDSQPVMSACATSVATSPVRSANADALLRKPPLPGNAIPVPPSFQDASFTHLSQIPVSVPPGLPSSQEASSRYLFRIPGAPDALALLRLAKGRASEASQHEQVLSKLRKGAAKALDRELAKGKSLEKQLADAEAHDEVAHLGELLSANLYRIEPGMSSITGEGLEGDPVPVSPKRGSDSHVGRSVLEMRFVLD